LTAPRWVVTDLPQQVVLQVQQLYAGDVLRLYLPAAPGSSAFPATAMPADATRLQGEHASDGDAMRDGSTRPNVMTSRCVLIAGYHSSCHANGGLLLKHACWAQNVVICITDVAGEFWSCCYYLTSQLVQRSAKVLGYIQSFCNWRLSNVRERCIYCVQRLHIYVTCISDQG
jgi:hypothetical protein